MTKPGKTTMTESEARALVNQYRSTLAATLDDDALIAEVRRRCASQAFNARIGDEVYGTPCEVIRLRAEGERVGEDLHCAVELLRQVYRTPTVVHSDEWVRNAARLEAVFNTSPTATFPRETEDD